MLMRKIEIQDFDDSVEVVERPVMFVGVYKISRAYGGPEEGGWYYDYKEHILSIPLIDAGSEEEVALIQEFLSPRFKSFKRTSYGGAKYEFMTEAGEAQHEEAQPAAREGQAGQHRGDVRIRRTPAPGTHRKPWTTRSQRSRPPGTPSPPPGPAGSASATRRSASRVSTTGA